MTDDGAYFTVSDFENHLCKPFSTKSYVVKMLITHRNTHQDDHVPYKTGALHPPVL